MEKKLDRQIFENALNSMIKYGRKSIMSDRIYYRRELLKKSMIAYYESTEEFEKCRYLIDFFNSVEIDISVGATGEYVE
jgi:hypothetical protein